jgi:hypothetical protein
MALRYRKQVVFLRLVMTTKKAISALIDASVFQKEVKNR